MKVLIIGRGGREHALAWKLKQDPVVKELFIAPGNGGTKDIGCTVPLEEDDLVGLMVWAKEQAIDLTVVGPEKPLVQGIVDLFARNELLAFGPHEHGAALEGSKILAKEIMGRAHVPTAYHVVVHSKGEVQEVLSRHKGSIVLKADGLAQGKGVVVAHTSEEAWAAAENLLAFNNFGPLILEEYLSGDELSLLALCHGENYVLLDSSRDHKRLGDGDSGPNTGGMGAYSPVEGFSRTRNEEIGEMVIAPILREMARRGTPYNGILYAGLMLTPDGPRVLEYNCRFGDPEAQALLPRLNTGLASLLYEGAQGLIPSEPLSWDRRSALALILASDGYPGPFEKGYPIEGLDDLNDVIVFHGGTALHRGQLITAGGRVLALTALDDDLDAARKKVYEAADKVDFKGKYYRRDIGRRG